MWAHTPARFLGMNDRALPGERKLVNIGNPASATDFQTAVPGGRMWRILGGNATFTASATAANRFPGIAIVWQGAVWWLQRSAAAIVASAVVNLSFGLDVTNAASGVSGSTVSVTTPYGWLPPTSVVESSTGTITAGDQYSAISLVVEEVWITDEELTENRDELERFELAAVTQLAAQQAANG